MEGWGKNTFVFWSEVYSCTVHQPQETKESESVSLARTQIFLSNSHKYLIKCKQIFSSNWHKTFFKLKQFFSSNWHKSFDQTQTIFYLQTHAIFFSNAPKSFFIKLTHIFKPCKICIYEGPLNAWKVTPTYSQGAQGHFGSHLTHLKWPIAV